ncbi:ferritin-like domain-containing protein [Sphingomonas sp. SCN 67-18]|uniref:ferritin-like domain-containing protein n=1 Tax=uncultured Sphingomonas sp. TaxID=158754 RepID=UPI000A471064|nr:ferritin-like domain-containing protein [Sphingomonas sp. SCN 67-18]
MIEKLPSLSRRAALGATATTLSGAGLMAMLGSSAPALALAKQDPAQDVALLNAAIGLEHEGISAYQIGAESGLLAQPVLALAVTFQGHHKQHRDELIAAVRRLGGEPVAAKSMADYAADLNAGSIKDQAGVLALALKLERGAANAYLGLIPSLGANEFHLLAARMAGDEAFHAAILGNALGEAVPEKGLMFG